MDAKSNYKKSSQKASIKQEVVQTGDGALK